MNTCDADNGIVQVETSKDAILWDKDANYEYYKHGPLSRAELGDLKVQGLDYAYTFGYTLGYFAGDYNPIGTFTTASKFEASTAGSDLLAARSDLWNGNISHMVTCLPKAGDYAANQTITPEAFGSAYQYDQLNRLSSSRVFTNINTTTNQWQSGAGTNPTAYATDYTYDAMGNILTQKRNGGGASPTALDELTYNYHTTTDGLVSNRLYQVNDVVSAGNYTDDIDDQGTFNNTHSTIENANNYGYDELGNLVRDAQEEIASIEWTVYGKMKKITRTGASSKADLEFGYDASGNRLWKKVTPKGSGAVISTYYYLRDAQGNEMCRYVKYTNTSSQLMYVAQEHSIYGSSRVGVDNRKDTLYIAGSYSPSWGGVGTSRRALGLKSFELANHLGNVLVTVSDKPVYNVSSGTIYFQPEVTSASDYYPFGAPIQGRSFSSTEYRFGFNTQEKTDEIAGPGNHNTATFWEYDTRLGRRWNVDPVTKPWESLYACLSDNPILLNDPNGDLPPTIKQIIDKGKKSSPTFAVLIQTAKITDDNFGQIISFGDITATTISKEARITLTQSNDINEQIIKLTHELTNRITNPNAINAYSQVERGIITPSEYAILIAQNEKNGTVNQIKVAAEIGYRFKDNMTINQLIEDYKSDNRINLFKRLLVSQDHFEEYKADGKKARQNYLKLNSGEKNESNI